MRSVILSPSSIAVTSGPAASPGARPVDALSQEEYAHSIVSCQDSIHTLEASVAHLQAQARTLDGEMYDHRSMQEACAHNLAHAQAAARSAGITMGVGYGVAATAAVGCIASGSIWLGLLSAGSALLAVSATKTRNRALEAAPKSRSMKEFVEREIAVSEQQRRVLDENLRRDGNSLAGQRAQLELLQVASRVSAPPAEAQHITQTDDAVQIGGVSVPRRDAAHGAR